MFLYKSVYEYGEAEYIIEKSRFIAHVSPAETPEEARLFISGIKEKYRTLLIMYRLSFAEQEASISGQATTESRRAHQGCLF